MSCFRFVLISHIFSFGSLLIFPSSRIFIPSYPPQVRGGAVAVPGSAPDVRSAQDRDAYSHLLRRSQERESKHFVDVTI